MHSHHFWSSSFVLWSSVKSWWKSSPVHYWEGSVESLRLLHRVLTHANVSAPVLSSKVFAQLVLQRNAENFKRNLPSIQGTKCGQKSEEKLLLPERHLQSLGLTPAELSSSAKTELAIILDVARSLGLNTIKPQPTFNRVLELRQSSWDLELKQVTHSFVLQTSSRLAYKANTF